MARMPPELASTVRDLSKDSPLWRLNAAARLALSLAEYEKTETYGDDPAALPASILLSEVEAWERGRLLVRRVVSDEKKPELAEETIATDSFIRLAIDTYGLLHIKRLPARPAYNGTTSAGKLAYTLCEAKTLNGAMFISRMLTTQLGLGRIELPAGLPGLQIWDTPAPPPIEGVAYMRKHLKRVSPTSYLHVVDLEAITGLTLLSDGNVLGLHAHTVAEPSATVTAARVRKEGYSPQLTQDELTLMFRKRLSGDTLLGYSFYNSPSETILTAPSEQPRALVYSAVNTINGVITDVGVYNVAAAPDVTAAAWATSVRNGTRRHCFNHSAYPDEQLTEDAFQSNVPLAGVTYMQVYTTKDTSLLRSIILTYDNGSQRALGMCCVATDIDAVREYARPRAT
ncbi:hypothetical protein DTO012A8_10015 [Penicillium roqueforti]|nr:hypothetical protein DTO012A8_10015 [Penicillium roqueforti]